MDSLQPIEAPGVLTASEARNVWDEALAAFLAGKRTRSEATFQSYRYAVRDFFATVAPGRTPEQVSVADVAAYKAHLERKGNRPGTVGTRIAAVSSFYRFLTRPTDARGGSLVAANPAAWIERPKVSMFERPRKMALPDFARLVAMVSGKSDLRALRDHALLLCYVFTGRRRAEIARLVGGDLERDDAGRLFYRYRGKGGKSGFRQLPPPAAAALERYLAASGRPTLGPTDAVFLSLGGRWSGQPLSPAGVLAILKARAREAGIPAERVKTHGLRHLSASLRRRAGATVEEIQAHLDHSSLAVTAVYLDKTEGKADESWQGVESLLNRATDPALVAL